MKIKFIVWVLSASVFNAAALAGTMGPVTYHADWAWVGTFSAGPVWENAGKTQTFNPGFPTTHNEDGGLNPRFA